MSSYINGEPQTQAQDKPNLHRPKRVIWLYSSPVWFVIALLLAVRLLETQSQMMVADSYVRRV